MDAHDTAALRDHLVSIKGWIEHWKGDADCRLPCTQESLAVAKYRAEAALRLIEARQSAA